VAFEGRRVRLNSCTREAVARSPLFKRSEKIAKEEERKGRKKFKNKTSFIEKGALIHHFPFVPAKKSVR
jgi:hypothetical protein